MTEWVGEAWSKVGKMKDFIIRSFKKCGLSVALDGRENDEVNIEGNNIQHSTFGGISNAISLCAR